MRKSRRSIDTPEAALRDAIAAAGTVRVLASWLGISHQAVVQWTVCPPLRVLDVERHTGVSRHRLRPDLYPLELEEAVA